MIREEAYPFLSIAKDRYFKFDSIGTKGTIRKVIMFQDTKYPNRYNLAFGDIINDGLDDLVKSGNNDVYFIFNTIVNAVHYFLDKHPNSQIEFSGSDEKRHRFYAIILKRYYSEAIEVFDILGMIDDETTEPINFDKFYGRFLIQKSKK